MNRIAIASCAAFADGLAEDKLLVAALAERGAAADITVWSDPAVDWSVFDATILRSTWDYTTRRAEFLAWTDRVPRLFNPAPVVRANSDKRYLAELQSAGIPVVPTTFFAPDEPVRLPAAGHPEEYVLKPSVGAGAKGAARFDASRPEARTGAAEHAAHLQQEGRTVMLQPYLADVDVNGETSLMYFDGRFSHAIRKAPLLPPDTRNHLSEPGLASAAMLAEERITARTPSEAELALGRRVLEQVNSGSDEPLLYARVDLLPTADGPVVIELELTEPSLFLDFDDAAAGRLAEAVVGRLG